MKDPGVDHMSAMKVIDEITEKGGKCFYLNPLWGLVAPVGYNRWNYKFKLAPACVVLAGQGRTAKFIQEGTYKYILLQFI
jgi:hypothetical protein